MGVSFVASTMSSKVKDMSRMITDAMDHPGFAIVHVQSPCTTYHDTYEQLKGNLKKGIEPIAWDIPDDHDPTDADAAHTVADAGGVPLGVIYRDDQRPTFHQRVAEMGQKAKPRDIEKLIGSHAV